MPRGEDASVSGCQESRLSSKLVPGSYEDILLVKIMFVLSSTLCIQTHFTISIAEPYNMHTQKLSKLKYGGYTLIVAHL